MYGLTDNQLRINQEARIKLQLGLNIITFVLLLFD